MTSRPRSGQRRHRRILMWSAALTASVYLAISILSWRFYDETKTADRPIVVVLLLFSAAFGLYLYAVPIATRARQDRRLLATIISSSILFRLILLFSAPIQEIDIYRYLWDGAVSSVGVSPFRYSPDQVRLAASAGTDDAQLNLLVDLQIREPALAQILDRIHFGELPTIYPPTSQAVFFLAAECTPLGASTLARLFIMKAWLLGFDIATLWIVIGLLQACRKPPGLCLLYGWCPLLIKEVANSGHLDSIAVFLSSLALYTLVRVPLRAPSSAAESGVTDCTGHKPSWRGTTLASFLLALGVGAKLYPIILAPLFLIWILRERGRRAVVVPLLTISSVTIGILSPMFPHQAVSGEQEISDYLGPAELADTSSSTRTDPSLGVATFLQRWEMNDFIFLILIENLKPGGSNSESATPWFSVIGEPTKRQLVHLITPLGASAEQVPFVIARGVTLAVFLVVATLFACQGTHPGPDSSVSRSAVCEAAFLTLAWFWLLCPTQNPWYWTWTLPLLPFARSRVWWFMSAIVMVYYLRFWFSYHWPARHVLGTSYVGYEFFDFVVTWFEFAPWFIWLAVDALWRRRDDRLSIVARHAEVGACQESNHDVSGK